MNMKKAINMAKRRAEVERKEMGYYAHGVIDTYEKNPLIHNWINVHTHGLERYGLTNISIVAPKDDKRLSEIIYTVADMMLEGEEFDPEITHYIDEPDGTCRFKFRMMPCKCWGEDSFRLILTDTDTNLFSDEDGLESIYCLQETTLFEDIENSLYSKGE